MTPDKIVHQATTIGRIEGRVAATDGRLDLTAAFPGRTGRCRGRARTMSVRKGGAW